MRFSIASTLVVALAADAVLGSSWFGKAAYNKWHETELERWLSDHDIAYPTPADRKDLENLVKENWQTRVGTPYAGWEPSQMQTYLSNKGYEVKKGTEKNKDSLIEQIKTYWHETEDQASEAFSSVKDWIFDSWSESQLKAFLDRHGIPNPQPRTRDTLLKSARENYQSVAEKAGETAAYPGNWLYESWTDSDLKAWLDEHGVPAPKTKSRDKLVAAVRRNSRMASYNVASLSSAAAASASSATQSVSDAIFDTWSDSKIKEWADKNGIKVPQGSKRNELLALARKHKAKLTGDNVASSASSAYGAATSSVGDQYAQATDEAAAKTNQAKGFAQGYIDWIWNKIGLGAAHASASVSSAGDAATDSLRAATDSAHAATESAKSAAAGAASSASSKGQKAYDGAAEAASSAKHRASEAAQRASDRAKEEL